MIISNNKYKSMLETRFMSQNLICSSSKFKENCSFVYFSFLFQKYELSRECTVVLSLERDIEAIAIGIISFGYPSSWTGLHVENFRHPRANCRSLW